MKKVFQQFAAPLSLVVGLLGCQSTESGKDLKLFSLLTSSETGVTFNNEVKDLKEHNILKYANYYGGAGVGVGDFNQDGLPDLFFAGNLVDDRLYLNQGDFRFQDISKKAGLENNGSWSSGVVVGDVNNDGWEDIYVTCELFDDKANIRANKLYINQGDLTFKNEAENWHAADTSRTRHATFLDYDNDGDLDLFLLNQPPNPGNYSKFRDADLSLDIYSPRLLKNVTGDFVDVTIQAGLLKSGFPNSVVATDLDKDGFTDLYVSNDFEAPDFFYHNNGDGTFTDILQEAVGHTSFYSMGVDAADINNDGLSDIMVLDMVAEDNFRLKANMSGMDPTAFHQVVRNGGHYQYMFNTMQLNQGKNIFSDIAQLAGIAATDWSWSNLIADFDNDGDKDIYITNGLVRDIRNTDAQKEFVKEIVKITNEYIREHPDDAEVTIFDIINLEEILNFIPSEKLFNYVYSNNGDLSFSPKMTEWGLDQKSFSNGSAYTDLNNDGFLDLVVNNINEEAYILKNNGAKTEDNHYLRLKLKDPNLQSVLDTEVQLTTGNQDQYIFTTSVRGMYSTSEQVVHFGIGQYETVEKVSITWPDKTITVLTDIEADQVLEVEKSNVSSPAKEAESTLLEVSKSDLGLDFQHKENYFDDYQYQVLLPHELSHFGPGLAVGDVNSDDLDDVFIGGASGQSGKLFIQKKSGQFVSASEQPWSQQSIMEDVDALFCDVNGDSFLDLYIASGGNEFEVGNPFYQDRVYLNDGTGKFQFQNEVLPKMSISTSRVLPFDFDNDGDLDLFLGEHFKPRDYPSPASAYLLENINGKFKDVTKQKAPEFTDLGLITDASITDLNGDEKPDLLITGEWMSPKIFINEDNRFIDRTKGSGLSGATGWWFSVSKGDFDKDGDDDFILGNLGKNYKYKASPEEPFEVYYNDFDENGKKDIVLSYYNFGKKYPLRGKSCSTQQVPDLSEKFDSYELFASAELVDVYEVEKLQGGLHRTANSFANTYIENLGNGTFNISELPMEAQLSVVNDALVEDFNHDGNLDVLLGGNLYVAEVETPRADAGIGALLLGDGNGEFEFIHPAKSGVYVSKDIRRISSVARAKDKIVVIASNDNHLTVLKTDLK